MDKTESLEILEERIAAHHRGTLLDIDMDAEAIREAHRKGESTDVTVTLDDFLIRLEDTAGDELEEMALDMAEAAATWSRADHMRASKALRKRGATVSFCREWRSSVRAVARDMQAEDEVDQERLTTNIVADEILETDHFARDEGGHLWVYEQGVYVSEGREHVERRTKGIYVDRGRANEWSSYRADEVRKYLLADAEMLLERPPSTKINLANGIYDAEKRALEPHTPAFRTPVQIPVTYDPAATCQNTERFLEMVLPQDVLEASVHWQIVAWILTTDMSVQKALLLLGGGANGKSTWLEQLTAFLGVDNVVNKSLQYLETSRFATVALMGKLANICPDLPSEDLTSTAVFKALTGGDRLPAEYKHGASFDYRPYCKPLFSANDAPRSSDSSEAFYRRWITIRFPNTFGPDERRPREELDAELSDPTELSGILNKALEWLPHVRRQGITETPSMRETRNEFREATDPFAVWAEDELTEQSNALVSCSEARKAYNRRAKREGWPSMSNTRFGQRMRDTFPQIQRRQRTWKGDPKTYCYVGLGFSATDGVDVEKSGCSTNKSRKVGEPGEVSENGVSDSPTSPTSANCTEEETGIPHGGSVEKGFTENNNQVGELGEVGEWENEMMEEADQTDTP